MKFNKEWDTYIIDDVNNSNVECSIRFKNQGLNNVRSKLLADLSREYFAVLLAKRECIDDYNILKIIDVVYPSKDDYKNQGGASLRINFDTFMKDILIEVDDRIDVDTIIDVHTHPFSKKEAWFSGVDDKDEANFALYLNQYNINYASIVFSQKSYKARYWVVDEDDHPWYFPAYIKTQKKTESIDEYETNENTEFNIHEVFDRSIKALGLDTMRKISNHQTITIVGVGGLGSIVAEHLIHMGFNSINLVDFDKLELSNMNRIVGATYKQAEDGILKVEAIKQHLLSINPKADVKTYSKDIFENDMNIVIAKSDWVIMATDNHASRFHLQDLCFKYFVPFIASGVNITVCDNAITDISGEAILVRMGDKVCLNCLGRVNYNEIAKEKHPDPVVREGLIRKGYVQGKDIHEPAVKTLNTYLATIVVDILINQFTERKKDSVILVYEDNIAPCIYDDKYSVIYRNKNCYQCNF